jgi:hypothetical protein
VGEKLLPGKAQGFQMLSGMVGDEAQIQIAGVIAHLTRDCPAGLLNSIGL